MDNQLQALREQVAAKQRSDSALSALDEQKLVLSQRILHLEKTKNKEQADVNKLEDRSFTNLLLKLSGTQKDKLNTERKEAYEAALQYQTAVNELQAVDEKITTLEEDLRPLLGCEEQYNKLLNQKRATLMTPALPQGEELKRLEDMIEAHCLQRTEIDEVFSEGEKANSIIHAIEDKLNEAKNWGLWDTVGGGTISTAVKYTALNEAQQNLGRLRIQLQHFNAQLSDIAVSSEVTISIHLLLKLSDYLLDDHLTEVAVLDRIQKSLDQVRSTGRSINQVLGELMDAKEKLEDKIKMAQERINTIINQSVLI